MALKNGERYKGTKQKNHEGSMRALQQILQKEDVYKNQSRHERRKKNLHELLA